MFLQGHVPLDTRRLLPDNGDMTIDILCKVVDNYGDIGVVYRLAKALSYLDPSLRLRLIVDDLASFQAMAPSIDPRRDAQTLNGWTVLRWDFAWDGFRREAPSLVLECFACGRPDFFESCLFDPELPGIAHIVNVEHLSAEAWADDFHLMPSLTRSARVKKHIFMPGFTAATGGLIMDRRFSETMARWRDSSARPALRKALAKSAGLTLQPGHERRYWLSVFAYERDYGPIVADLAAYDAERPLLALVAAGKSSDCFLGAWERAGKPFPTLALPFLPQETWDEVLMACDFSIVRGEESLARASLIGKPFLWQAYLQDGGHHMVKLRALLDRLEPQLEAGAFSHFLSASVDFNERPRDDAGWLGRESILPALRDAEAAEPGFSSFSRAIAANGDMAAHLLTFLRDLV